jgi:hypothetical protein
MTNGNVKYKERDILLPEPQHQRKSECGIMQQIYKEMQSNDQFSSGSVGNTSEASLCSEVRQQLASP